MDWLRKALGMAPQLNPEEYERMRCDLCHGTGLMVERTTPDGSRPTQFKAPLRHCGHCHGKGYLLVKRPD
jgi:hypothetical protein